MEDPEKEPRGMVRLAGVAVTDMSGMAVAWEDWLVIVFELPML